MLSAKVSEIQHLQTFLLVMLPRSQFINLRNSIFFVKKTLDLLLRKTIVIPNKIATV